MKDWSYASLVLSILGSIAGLLSYPSIHALFSVNATLAIYGIVTVTTVSSFLYMVYKFGFLYKGKVEFIYRHRSWLWIDDNTSQATITEVLVVRRPYLKTAKFTTSWFCSGQYSYTTPFSCSTHDAGHGPKIKVEYPIDAFYGDVKTVQYTIYCHDPEGKQAKVWGLKETRNKEALLLEVVLSHISKAPVARLQIRKATCPDSTWETLCPVSFNEDTRSYRCFLPEAKVGYGYMINWEQDKSIHSRIGVKDCELS